MKRFLLFISIITFLFSLSRKAQAQGSQTVNNGAATSAINFPGVGSVYKWVIDKPVIGLAASGTGDISPFIAANTGRSPVMATITVNQTPATPPAIIASTATGNISACAGTKSVSPFIQQFTVSGSGLTSGITAAAPANFEVSLAPGSGYGSSVTLGQSGGVVGNTIVYVRSAAIATAGGISGTVVLASAGAISRNVRVAGRVNGLPGVNAVADQIKNNGDLTDPVHFTGTANTFTWTNDSPGIGLAASGTGDISPFTAVNTGTTPVIAKVTVTPVNAGLLYIANEQSKNISVVNALTHAVTATLDGGDDPYGVSVSPDGKRAYVSNFASGTIAVVDIATNKILKTIQVGNNPWGSSMSSDGRRLYVANEASNSVSVINTSTNSVIATVLVGDFPVTMLISPDGRWLYVANDGSASVSVINTATNTVVRTIPVSLNPMTLAASPDGSIIYTANPLSNNVSVISTITNTVIATIPVGMDPWGIAISRDGKWVYVSNYDSNSVSVISTATNQVTNTISVGWSPLGVSVDPVSGQVLVVNSNSNDVSVIDPATNSVVATVPVGAVPLGLNSLVTGGAQCSGQPITFTITVNPSPPPVITLGLVTGNISACAGTASVSPNIEQFTVSGSGLTADVVAAASPGSGFEVSLNAGSGYGNSITVTPSGGAVGNTVVYVRSSPSAPTGTLSGSVLLTSAGAASQSALVTGTVNALPNVNNVSPQAVNNGDVMGPINFTGTADTFSWVNDTPGIGLAASGTGDIASFIAINSTQNAIVATVVVTPASSITGCTGPTITLKITIEPTPPAAITATGNLSPLTTVYGTASSSTVFMVSGTNMTAGILVTPPPTGGFEVSTDDITYSNTVTVGAAGTIATTTVYIRLAATTHVGNTYMGNISLSSAGAPDANEPMPQSSVTPAKLVVIADDKSKTFGEANPILTATYIGFVNNDGPAQLAVQPVMTTIATATSPVGQYPITATGTSSPDYNITPVDGTLTITPVLPQTVVVPNTFTPNGDGINDTWHIKYIESFPQCKVEIYSRYGENVFSSIGYGVAWNGTYKGAALPTGTYYYIIDLKNDSNPLSGFVAIIR